MDLSIQSTFAESAALWAGIDPLHYVVVPATLEYRSVTKTIPVPWVQDPNAREEEFTVEVVADGNLRYTAAHSVRLHTPVAGTIRHLDRLAFVSASLSGTLAGIASASGHGTGGDFAAGIDVSISASSPFFHAIHDTPANVVMQGDRIVLNIHEHIDESILPIEFASSDRQISDPDAKYYTETYTRIVLHLRQPIMQRRMFTPR